jgi:hypothetical protein
MKIFFFARLFATFFAALVTFTSNTNAGSLRSLDNGANQYEHTRLSNIPAQFGAGEFTFEVWIKPDNRAAYPAGTCGTGGNTRLNWCTENVARYSVNCWWCNGNFLLDGVDFGGSPQGGTFALQFYGGGRLRWLFGDGSVSQTLDGYWSIGNGTTTNNPVLLDGQWHHVAVVRRWVGASNAALEMWIDGVLIDTQTSNRRPDLWTGNWEGISQTTYQYAPWYFFAEKQAAVGALPSFEDYKGLLDEVRFWNRAKTSSELTNNWRNAVVGTESGLSGWYDFTSIVAGKSCNRQASTECMVLYDSNPSNSIVATDNAPTQSVGGGVAPTITSAASTAFTIAVAGSFQVQASGTPAPTFSASGALPSGVSFSAATGLLSGTPAAGSAGTYPLSIGASNASGSVNQSFNLTVNRANQTIAFTLPSSGKSGLTLSLAATASSGLPIVYSITSTPSSGVCSVAGATLTMTAAGACNVTANQPGNDSFLPATNVTRSITIAANTPPVAVDDAVIAVPGVSITANVLANDTDPDGDALTVLSVSAGTLGATSIVNNQIVLTTPSFGIERLTYTVSDGRGGSATANLVFLVGARPASMPLRALPDAFTLPARRQTRLDVLANDEGFTDRASVRMRLVTGPRYGRATVRNQQFVYIPRAGTRQREDEFVYELVDEKNNRASARVQIIILEP